MSVSFGNISLSFLPPPPPSSPPDRSFVCFVRFVSSALSAVRPLCFSSYCPPARRCTVITTRKSSVSSTLIVVFRSLRVFRLVFSSLFFFSVFLCAWVLFSLRFLESVLEGFSVCSCFVTDSEWKQKNVNPVFFVSFSLTCFVYPNSFCLSQLILRIPTHFVYPNLFCLSLLPPATLPPPPPPLCA